MNVFIVTYCPGYTEQVTIRKVFKSLSSALEYIEKEKEREVKLCGIGWMGDFDWEEYKLEDEE